LKTDSADIDITASSEGYANSTLKVMDASLTSFENTVSIKMNKFVNITVQMQDVNGTPISRVFQTVFNGA
jgi:glutamate formiminotransferase